MGRCRLGGVFPRRAAEAEEDVAGLAERARAVTEIEQRCECGVRGVEVDKDPYDAAAR